ncbi:hypothetical protein AB0F43_31070 [Kribbella sp. NPDC023972]|uniref:hypothetical protein n=1 Tax=Kribbella sp. NPDC023972 TaxID=3154795 RepID=UPI00340215C9
MIYLTTDQILPGLIIGSVFVAISWLGLTDRYVNRVVDSFIEHGRATDLDRQLHARRLRTVAIAGMAMGLFVFGYSLANLLSG